MPHVSPSDPGDQLGKPSNPWAEVHGNAHYEGADRLAKVTRPVDEFGNPSDTTDLDATTSAHGLMPKLDKQKLDGIEAGATADQTDEEIETAYNNQVDVVSQVEAESGISTTVRRWTAQRVKQAIEALASLSWGNITGTLSDQTDLQNALDTKYEEGDSPTFEDATVDSVIILDDSNEEQGRVVPVAGGGVAIASTSDGTYDENDGGLAALDGRVELHGAATQVKALEGSDSREVWVSSDGTLYPVTPSVDSSWSESDTDTGQYDLGTGTGTGSWVELTGLEITVPQAVTSGDRVDIFANLWISNKTSNRSGNVEVGFGINGASPANGISRPVPQGFNGYIPTNISTTTVTLSVSDTITIFARITGGSNAQYGVDVDGSQGTLNLGVSTPASGSVAPEWGTITGTLSDQSDLQSALDAKYESGDSPDFADITATGDVSANTVSTDTFGQNASATDGGTFQDFIGWQVSGTGTSRRMRFYRHASHSGQDTICLGHNWSQFTGNVFGGKFGIADGYTTNDTGMKVFHPSTEKLTLANYNNTTQYDLELRDLTATGDITVNGEIDIDGAGSISVTNDGNDWVSLLATNGEDGVFVRDNGTYVKVDAASGFYCVIDGTIRLNVHAGGVSNLRGLYRDNSACDIGTVAQPWRALYVENTTASGDVDFTGLPTSDPTVAGRLWNDSGTLKVSAG